MKLYQQAAVFLSLALGAALPAHADGNGIPARWTKDDVSAMCHSRWGSDDQSRSFKDCVDRNSGKIGRDETPGDIAEIKAFKGGAQ